MINLATKQICEFWENYKSQFVKINWLRLNILADEIRKMGNEIFVPDWQIPEVLPEDDAAFISHSFYICAVDFAFTHFEPPHENYILESGIHGSNAASACFYRRFGNRNITPEDIFRITDSLVKTEAFFHGRNLPPLIEKRMINLAEAAQVVKKCFAGDPINILREANFQTWAVIELLTDLFPVTFGADYYNWTDSKTHWRLQPNKRAQLWPLIYCGRAVHSRGILTPLQDPHNIGPIADYLIPKLLRSCGVLEYNPELDRQIEKRALLPFGSPMEMEIRCATIYAVSALMTRTNFAMPALDYFLWSEGQKVNDRHHHLCPTTAY